MALLQPCTNSLHAYAVLQIYAMMDHFCQTVPGLMSICYVLLRNTKGPFMVKSVSLLLVQYPEQHDKICFLLDTANANQRSPAKAPQDTRSLV